MSSFKEFYKQIDEFDCMIQQINAPNIKTKEQLKRIEYDKRYHEKNKDHIIARRKAYYQRTKDIVVQYQQDNKLYIQKYQKEYRQKVKQKPRITCECGTTFLTSGLKQHQKSKKHLTYQLTKYQ